MTRRASRWPRRLSLLLVAALLATLAACSDDDAATSVQAPADASAEADAKLNAMLPEAIRDAGVVRVATDVPFPPFEMFESEGSSQITGVDYDLGQALAGKLGVAFEFEQQKFDGLIPALKAGKFDVILSAMSSNAERREVLDFVDYFSSGTAIMVKAGNPASIQTMLDLCDRTVAVQSGAQQVDFVEAEQASCEREGRGPIELLRLPKFSDAQLSLQSGKADAIVADKPTSAYTAKTVGGGTQFEVVDDPAAQGGYNAQPGGIGVLKGEDELVEALRAALQSLIDDGTYEEILDRYGVGSIAVPEARVNSGA